jgi:hypothetical protein
MTPISENHPLRRVFAGLVENVFCGEIGLCDPRLTTYVVDVLVGFLRTDELEPLHRADDRSIEQLATMLALHDGDLHASRRERDRHVYRRIGDFSLFWAGLYPEHLKRSRPRQTDILLEYVSRGKRSYAIVSQLTAEEDAPPSSLFRHLSEDFEYCLYGLGVVRRELVRHDLTDPDRLDGLTPPDTTDS